MTGWQQGAVEGGREQLNERAVRLATPGIEREREGRALQPRGGSLADAWLLLALHCWPHAHPLLLLLDAHPAHPLTAGASAAAA